MLKFINQINKFTTTTSQNIQFLSYIPSYNYIKMDKKTFGPDEIEAKLKELGIEYTMHEHDPVVKIDEMKEKINLKHAPFIKNIFSQDKKKGNCYLISAHHDSTIGKFFYKKVGTSNGNCRKAEADMLDKALGVKPGAVTPLGLINDYESLVAAFVFDENLMKEEYLSFHPCVNTKTVELKREDFFKYLQHINRKAEVLNLNMTEEDV